ncbi:hypothetical protein DPMN_160701 [Dreissena polymorpha]|uniref:Uncharacterized protein n=1 Tax=Dreissena polymorpha TaxID=45954 RepID=A0A9D4IP03_DREPO|nr:hypothetical protein DPMN_160701 [Dreissena polymorpha]
MSGLHPQGGALVKEVLPADSAVEKNRPCTVPIESFSVRRTSVAADRLGTQN